MENWINKVLLTSTEALRMRPNDEASAEFDFFGRYGSPLFFPVPYFTPTKDNTYIAFDIFPKGTPGNQAHDRGPAWHDICSTDINADGTNYECLRLSKLANGAAVVTAAAGGTGVGSRPLVLQKNKGPAVVGCNAEPETFSGVVPTFQVTGKDGDPTTALSSVFRWSSLAATAGQYILARSRGADGPHSRGIVQSNDRLGQVGFYGDDGVNFIIGAGIRAEVDGAPAEGAMPTRVIIATAGPTGGVVERVRVDKNGDVSVAGGKAIYANRVQQLRGFTVATLPAGSEGMKAYVTDATMALAGGVGSPVVGGGANKVPVFHDGANWLIG